MTKMARQGIKEWTQRTQRTQGKASRQDGKGWQGKDAAAGRRTAGRSKVAQYSHSDFERVLRCAVVEIF
jgi:hypothetical protein